MGSSRQHPGDPADDWSRTASGLARAVGSGVSRTRLSTFAVVCRQTDVGERIAERLRDAIPTSQVSVLGYSAQDIAALRLVRPAAVVVAPDAAATQGPRLIERLKSEAASVARVVLLDSSHSAAKRRLEFVSAGAHSVALISELDADEILYTLESAQLRHAPYHRLERMAYIDGLTGLPNRASIPVALDSLWHRARDMRRPVTTLLLDLAGFRLLNDTLGHEVGNSVLKVCAKRLRRSLVHEDVLARWDGDTFMVSSLRPRDDEAARVLARTLVTELEKPVEVEGQSLFLSSCVGVVASSTTECPASTALRQADIALSQAKTLGHGSISLYDPNRGTEVRQQLEMWSSLRRAVREQQFELHYQPQVSMRTGELTGVEALLRWRREDGGLVSPIRFVPLLERGRLISEVGAWIFARACEDMKVWDEGGLIVPHVSVNISPYQLRDCSLFETVEEIRESDPECFRRLRAELTESAVVDSEGDERRNLDRLVNAGLRFALDDFGTGFASILQLAELPIDTLKLDRSLISAMGRSPRVEKVVENVVSLAGGLGLGLIAEGVETESEWDTLDRHGVERAQGYFIGRPMPASEMVHWSQRWSRRTT